MQETLGILVLVAAIVAVIKNPHRRDAEVEERLKRRESAVRMKRRLGLPLDWEDTATIFARQMRF